MGLRGLRGGRPHEQHAPTGIVLGTIFVGGSLMAGDQLSPGDLMSFLVASQTVQRSVSPPLSPLLPPCHLMLSSPPRLQVPGEHLHPLRAGRGGPEGPSCRGGGVKGMGDTSSASVPPPLQVVRGLSAGARVFEFMTLEPQVPLRGGDTIPSHSLLGHVAFRHVSFRSAPPQRSPCATDVPRSPSLTSPRSYPTRPGHPVLQDFSLTLPPGETVAIVGPSGGGDGPGVGPPLWARRPDPTAPPMGPMGTWGHRREVAVVGPGGCAAVGGTDAKWGRGDVAPMSPW